MPRFGDRSRGLTSCRGEGSDGVVDVDRSVSFEEGDASPLEILQDATRFYNGVV